MFTVSHAAPRIYKGLCHFDMATFQVKFAFDVAENVADYIYNRQLDEAMILKHPF